MDERLLLLNELLDSLPVGVVTLDREGRVVHFNRAEEKLAKRSRQRALGRNFFTEIAPCMNVRELAGVFRDNIGRAPISVHLDISFAFPFLDGPRDVVVHMKSVDVRGAPYVALIIQDVSEQRASLRMQQTVADLLMQDLESPIANILASCGYLVQGAPQLDGRALTTVGDIAQSADHLQGMLANLLDISRLESGTMSIQLRRQPLWPSVLASVAGNRAYAARRGVVLEAVTDLPHIEAHYDAALVGRALDNLLQNAIRAAPRGTRVTVWAGELVEGQVGLEVTDEGPMIPPEVQELVFDKFARVDAEGPARADNRGLGLTLVKLVARAHGGWVALESLPDRGTVARLCLPNPEPATDFARFVEIDPSSF